MHERMFFPRAFLLVAVGILQGTFLTACGDAEQASAGEQVEGLWRYTGLTASDGQDLPLTGISCSRMECLFNSRSSTANPSKSRMRWRMPVPI